MAIRNAIIYWMVLEDNGERADLEQFTQRINFLGFILGHKFNAVAEHVFEQ